VNRDEAEVKAVMHSCKAAGFGSNVLHVKTMEEAENIAGPVIAVGCIPDLPPVTRAEIEAKFVVKRLLSTVSRGGVILEMAYHPKVWTRLAETAEMAGWKVVLGTEAVIWQGIEQHRLWTGRRIEDVPVQLCKDVFAKALGEVSEAMKDVPGSKL